MKVKLIDYGYTQAPERAHANDAGADVYSPVDYTIAPFETRVIPLGFGIEVPDGYAAYVISRSSFSALGLICDLPPIDSGYRGEIHAIVHNTCPTDVHIPAGTRIGQVVIMPVVIADFITHDQEERGTGAFGSTGGTI